MKRRPSKQRSSSNMQTAALGAAVSLIVLIAVCSLGALALSLEWLPESAAAVFAPLAVGLAAFLGPLPLIHRVGRKALPIAYSYMIGLLLVLLLVRSIVWTDTEFGSWVVPVSGVIGATLAALLSSRKKGKRR